MDSNQDYAINYLKVMNSERASGTQGGCAVFNGGINIAKNMIACEADLQLLESVNGKISDSLAVQNNIYTNGSILPLTDFSTAGLGTSDKKWNSIYTLTANIQELTSVNSSIKNASVDNLYLKTFTTNIIDISSGNSTFDVCLDSAVIIINLTSTYDISSRLITMNINNPAIGSNNNFHKIIFSQNYNNVVVWKYNSSDIITVRDKEQIFDAVNVSGLWKVLNYNISNKVNEASDKIDELSTKVDTIMTYLNL